MCPISFEVMHDNSLELSINGLSVEPRDIFPALQSAHQSIAMLAEYSLEMSDSLWMNPLLVTAHIWAV